MNMNYDLVVHGKIVDIENIFEAQVGIENGIIKEIKKQGLSGEKLIKAPSSSLIFPGFIDMHVHLREPGWEHKEDLSTGTRAAAHGGVTMVVDMPNTSRPTISKESAKEKLELIKKKAIVGVLIYGGIGPSNLHNIQGMADYVCGYKIFTCKSVGEMFFKDYSQIEEAIKQVVTTKKYISFHCEDQHINDKQQQKLKDKKYPDVHCDARPETSEVTALEKVLSLIEKYGIKANICHVSTARGLELIENFRQKRTITCEVTPHHLFFTRKDMKEGENFLKINPPLRTDKDRQALLEGIRNGEIDFLASDHAPHTIEEKETDIWSAQSGVPELDTYGNFVTWLINKRITPQQIMKIASYNPANFLKLNSGRIEKGRIANITILDLKNPEKVTSEDLYTKCGWSPFEGIEFPGRVVYTIYNGQILAERGQVLI